MLLYIVNIDKKNEIKAEKHYKNDEGEREREMEVWGKLLLESTNRRLPIMHITS